MKIPIEILEIRDSLRNGYHILCRVHINKKEFRMLIDTGATTSFFDISKLKNITQNISEKNDENVITLGRCEMGSEIVIIDEMIIGNVSIKNYKTILLDINHINNFYKNNNMPKIDGIIGGDILFHYNAIIDYNDRTLLFSKKQN